MKPKPLVVSNHLTVPLRVAYQGVEGSYSHLTAQRRYAGRKGGCLLSGYESVLKVADAVHSGEADVALLPIENSTSTKSMRVKVLVIEKLWPELTQR